MTVSAVTTGELSPPIVGVVVSVMDPIIETLLCQAIAKVRRIPTDKRNAAQGWSYASSDAIIGEAREILCQVGLYPTARLLGLRLAAENTTIAIGYAQLEVTTMAPAARPLVEVIEWPVILGGNGVPNRDLGRALEGAVTKAEGLYWRLRLMMDRGDPTTDVDDDPQTNPVRSARRDSERRNRNSPPREAAEPRRPSPPTPPTDGVDRLAREERLRTLRQLVKRMPSVEQAASELGLESLDEIKTLPMDALVRATAALTTWLEERAKRDDALVAAATAGAVPPTSPTADTQPVAAPDGVDRLAREGLLHQIRALYQLWSDKTEVLQILGLTSAEQIKGLDLEALRRALSLLEQQASAATGPSVEASPAPAEATGVAFYAERAAKYSRGAGG